MTSILDTVKYTVQDTLNIGNASTGQGSTVSYVVLALLIITMLWICDKVVYK